MVVEELTVDVDPGERLAWLEREQAVWDPFLSRQPGFAGKEIWLPADDDSTVRIVIWWETREQWDAVPADELAAVEAEMGPLRRDERCRAYEVLRPRG